ncbi:MAG: antibiotic biosynthesis monooxygenase [Gammaproteobacteria bacterium]|nr:antibiotic biosynthesis monooxygenase [Gammaproteobacteria bacterium]MDH3465758.1 antibiotic biosynthesis monooxygenase [Gammaproteobacteria bacterium]
MQEFVLVARYEVKDGSPEEVVDAALIESEAALRDEQGCRAFDIMASSGDDSEGLFYEMYDDEAAFEEHRETPHFSAFFSAIEDSTVEWTGPRYLRLSR